MNRLKMLFVHNFPAKALAVAIAFVMWVFVMEEQNPAMESGFSIPIRTLNAPGNSRITRDAEGVRVKLRAPRSAFASMDPDELRAVVDLAALEPGTHRLPVQAAGPQGFEVLSVTPEQVTVTIDPMSEKRVPVRLVRAGMPPAGMTVAGMTPDADTVMVIGPRSMVEQVEQAVGAVVFPSAATDDAHVDVTLRAFDAEGQEVGEVRIAPQAVTAQVTFARGLARKVVEVKPVLMGEAGAEYAVAGVRAEPARIEIAGESETIAGVTSLSTEPIPLSGMIETAQMQMQVPLALPEGVTVTNRMVTVTVEVRKN